MAYRIRVETAFLPDQSHEKVQRQISRRFEMRAVRPLFEPAPMGTGG
jgi:hypothetical protein